MTELLTRVRTWCSATTWGSAWWQQGLVAGIAAMVIAPQASVDADVGLDPGWEAVVALAPVQHIPWGPGLVFTYGPLGYLQTTAYYSFGQSALATVYQFAVVAALYLGVAAALRQRHPPMISIIGAFVTTGIAAILQVGHGTALGMMYPELAVLAALAWAAVPMLHQDPKRSTVFATCAVLGAVAGLQLLVKFNTGLTILIIAVSASLLFGWKAVVRHSATLIAFVVSTVIWWLLAGQRLADLAGWLKSSAEILSGYNESQAVPLTQTSFPAIVLSLAWIVALCVIFARGGPEIPRKFVVLAGILTAITVKSGFGRFDIWHFSMVLGVIVVVTGIVPRVRIRDRVVVVIAVVLVFANIAGPPAVHNRAITAVRTPTQGIDRLLTLVVPGRVEKRIQQAKAHQRAIYGIPQRFIDTIGHNAVHVDPDETSVVWAYDFAWRPAPVFATYSAYTPSLDKLNSDTLATGGPEFVLSRVSSIVPATGIDNRLGTQESPLYSRALLCAYTLAGVENHWALFTRTAPRCGPLAKLSEVDVDNNNAVTIPAPSAPDKAVLMGIDLAPTVIDRLFLGTVIPLTTFTVVLDGTSYRLIPSNAADPFLVITPSSVNGSNLEIHAHTVAVGRSHALGQSPVHARLRFYEMGVAPPRAR
ncbi:hypothetical protein [Mycobacterium riyadhense]|uniref:hypothetical protein n=1 Tax=Mycobacterium riyadhense TaxID=486698 RepID=UPI00194F6151|nr:hypothetical protein [Mycobacterium riyadhense]